MFLGQQQNSKIKIFLKNLCRAVTGLHDCTSVSCNSNSNKQLMDCKHQLDRTQNRMVMSRWNCLTELPRGWKCLGGEGNVRSVNYLVWKIFGW